jgi:hypothetical protein
LNPVAQTRASIVWLWPSAVWIAEAEMWVMGEVMKETFGWVRASR